MTLSDEELARYARHIVMPQVGGIGQNKLKAARVAVIGAGASAARSYRRWPGPESGG